MHCKHPVFKVVAPDEPKTVQSMELDEDSVDVEFDSEFMRLYYDQIRAGPPCISYRITDEKKNHRVQRGGLRKIIGQTAKRQCTPSQIIEGKKCPQRLIETTSTKLQKIIRVGKEGELSVSNSRLTYKSTILKERSPAFLRMVCSRTCIQIDIFDGNGAPVLNKQVIRMGSSHTVIRFQVIKEILMRDIAGKEEIKIPQIVTCNDDMKIFLCPLKECNNGFLHPLVAKNHALSHLDLRPFSCHFFGCGWTFAKESHLQRHLATHENTKNHPCDVPGCDKLFTTIYNLNEHRKKRHIQPATKPCPVLSCKETFRNEKELRTHCKQHNHYDAPFKCAFSGCKRAFFFQSTLEVHTKTHLEENQHICTYDNCNKIFQQAYRLKEHMRCHTGAKPYKCTIGKCTKGFSTASKLKRHEISHFDNKHHYCNVEGCDKAFKRSDHLNEHIRQVHKGITQGGQKASPPCQQVETSFTEKASSANVSCVVQAYICTEELPKPVVTSGPSTSGCYTITSEDEETDLSNYIAFSPYGSTLPGCSSISGCSKTEDELLDEAIKSLGVPEMKLETDLFLDEPLDLSDFSTVNLRDLH